MSIQDPSFHTVEWDHAHPVPEFTIPDGWYRNDSMTNHNGSQVSIRSGDWRYHIDVNAVVPLATVDGPYFAECRVQVGPDDSFETKTLRRLVGVEPGGVQDAVYSLVGTAIDHEQGWSE